MYKKKISLEGLFCSRLVFYNPIAFYVSTIVDGDKWRRI